MFRSCYFRGHFVTTTALLSIVLTFSAPLANAAPSAKPWSYWDMADPSSTKTIDHSAWQLFLDTHIKQDGNGINRVAYQKVSKSAHAELQAYIATLAMLDPRKYGQSEKMAYWINLYNAITVDVVLSNPDKDSIRQMGQGFFSSGPWDDEVVTVAGKALTLNDIEHRILRPIFNDHPVHYAVNCASVSCPNLSANAYTGASLDDQLTHGEHDYVRNERAVSFDEDGQLVVSKIFEWYAEDFAMSEKGLLRYLAKKHNCLAEQIRSYQNRVRYEYDWALNAADAS